MIPCNYESVNASQAEGATAAAAEAAEGVKEEHPEGTPTTDQSRAHY